MTAPHDAVDWQEWLEHLRESSRVLLASLDPTTAPHGQALLALRGAWLEALDLAMASFADHLRGSDHWRNALAGQCDAIRKDIERQLRHGGPGLPPDLRWLQAWLSGTPERADETLSAAMLGMIGQPWPALGPGGRHSERLRRLQAAIATAVDAANAYNLELTGVLLEAVKRWERTLADPQRPDCPPDAHTLLECWLESLESVHRDMLESEGHLHALGALNRALAQVRREALPFLEPWYRSMGLATARDLSGMQRRMHEWRRRTDAEVTALRAEVLALRRRIDDTDSGKDGQ